MFSPLSWLVGCLGEGQDMGQETTHSIEVQIWTKGANPGLFHQFSSLHNLQSRSTFLNLFYDLIVDFRLFDTMWSLVHGKGPNNDSTFPAGAPKGTRSSLLEPPPRLSDGSPGEDCSKLLVLFKRYIS